MVRIDAGLRDRFGFKGDRPVRAVNAVIRKHQIARDGGFELRCRDRNVVICRVGPVAGPDRAVGRAIHNVGIPVGRHFVHVIGCRVERRGSIQRRVTDGRRARAELIKKDLDHFGFGKRLVIQAKVFDRADKSLIIPAGKTDVIILIIADVVQKRGQIVLASAVAGGVVFHVVDVIRDLLTGNRDCDVIFLTNHKRGSPGGVRVDMLVTVIVHITDHKAIGRAADMGGICRNIEMVIDAAVFAVADCVILLAQGEQMAVIPGSFGDIPKRNGQARAGVNPRKLIGCADFQVSSFFGVVVVVSAAFIKMDIPVAAVRRPAGFPFKAVFTGYCVIPRAVAGEKLCYQRGIRNGCRRRRQQRERHEREHHHGAEDHAQDFFRSIGSHGSTSFPIFRLFTV